MKKIAYLFFATFITFMASSTGFSQGNPGGNNGEQGRQNEEYDRLKAEERLSAQREQRERLLRAFEFESPSPSYEYLSQLMLHTALKELDEAGDKLLTAVKKPGKKGFKESAKIAEKIAKLSKGFRKELNKNSPKAEPVFVTGEEDRLSQLYQLAESIDMNIDQVINPLTETLYSFNARREMEGRLEQTCKQLAEIESNALNFRQLARRKN